MNETTEYFLTKFLKNEGNMHLTTENEVLVFRQSYKNTYKMGKNDKVNEKLPRLPARNVYASLCPPCAELYIAEGTMAYLQIIRSR